MNPKRKINGQPQIMVAETVIGRDCVTFSLPKSILSEVPLANGKAYFCVTNGIVQISGEVPCATMPVFAANDDSFVPQVPQNA